MSQIVEFFDKISPDSEGRTLDYILDRDYEWMESCHDYIQWLFPLMEPSNYNPDAPIMTEEDRVALEEKGKTPTQRFQNIFEGVSKFINYMGIEDIWYFDSFDGFELKDFDQRKYVWAETFNHNHLRITRMLKFLSLIGWNRYGKSLVEFMKKTAAEKNFTLNPNSLKYWEEAVA
jgi:hypothetical protein